MRGPAWGDSPRSRTRREGERERVWEGRWGGTSAWPPWGQDPLPTRHPQQGPAVLGSWSREQRARAEGRRHVRGPCRKLSCPGSSSTDAVRVRPEISACLGPSPHGPFPNGLGWLPLHAPLPNLSQPGFRPPSSVAHCEVVWAGATSLGVRSTPGSPLG